ncbi:MAG: RNA polymerase sigma factor, partial [Gammaproteobacteria bacterium]
AHNKGLKILERARRREGSLEEYPGEIDSEEADASDAYDSAGPSASGPERVVMGWELGDAMGWAFLKLSANHRSVIELCFTEDRSYQEIADIMGCPINTVKTRVFHARKRLAESLARKGFSLPEQGKVAI